MAAEPLPILNYGERFVDICHEWEQGGSTAVRGMRSYLEKMKSEHAGRALWVYLTYFMRSAAYANEDDLSTTFGRLSGALTGFALVNPDGFSEVFGTIGNDLAIDFPVVWSLSQPMVRYNSNMHQSRTISGESLVASSLHEEGKRSYRWLQEKTTPRDAHPLAFQSSVALIIDAFESHPDVVAKYAPLSLGDFDQRFWEYTEGRGPGDTPSVE